jgi:hypothetical protein
MICSPNSTVVHIRKSRHHRRSGASLKIKPLGRNQAQRIMPVNSTTAVIFPQYNGILFSHSSIFNRLLFHFLFLFRPFLQGILDAFVLKHQTVHQAFQFFDRLGFRKQAHNNSNRQ